jgi:hypothetical protein
MALHCMCWLKQQSTDGFGGGGIGSVVNGWPRRCGCENKQRCESDGWWRCCCVLSFTKASDIKLHPKVNPTFSTARVH